MTPKSPDDQMIRAAIAAIEHSALAETVILTDEEAEIVLLAAASTIADAGIRRSKAANARRIFVHAAKWGTASTLGTGAFRYLIGCTCNWQPQATRQIAGHLVRAPDADEQFAYHLAEIRTEEGES